MTEYRKRNPDCTRNKISRKKINHRSDMKKILLLLCLCLFIEEVASRELDKTFLLLPQPQSIELTSGKGINYWELSYILSSDTTSIPILGDMLNKLPRCPRKGKPIRLQLTSQHVPASPEATAVGLLVWKHICRVSVVYPQ